MDTSSIWVLAVLASAALALVAIQISAAQPGVAANPAGAGSGTARSFTDAASTDTVGVGASYRLVAERSPRHRNYAQRYRVQSGGRIRSLTHDGNGTIRLGEEVKFVMRVSGRGSWASVQIGYGFGAVSLYLGEDDETWIGRYRVQQGDRVNSAPVTGYFDSDDGNRYYLLSAKRLSIDGGRLDGYGRDGYGTDRYGRGSGRFYHGRRVPYRGGSYFGMNGAGGGYTTSADIQAWRLDLRLTDNPWTLASRYDAQPGEATSQDPASLRASARYVGNRAVGV